MALPKDLLDQAVRLMSHEKKKPKQASLRRAVSTAYYAFFHLLVSEATKRMAPGSPSNLGLQMQRAFDHGAMKEVCKSFAGGTLPPFIRHLQAGQIEPGLRKVAKAFVDLQEKRHAADYDLIHTFTKQETADDLDKVKVAFATWKTVSNLPHSNVFLMALALPKMGRWRAG
jgi:uncharacterized protein (UPF0332 family)